MGQLIINEPTRAQALAVAAGLLAQKHYALAAKIYATAIRDFPPKESVPWKVRLGLATAPTRRTQAMVKALEALEEAGAANVFVSDGMATWLKTLPFIEDPRFMELAEKHAGLLPLPNWHWNLQTALWAAQEGAAVPGDFVELGVFKGHTTLFLASYMDFAAMPRTWRLYDTFEGIPEDQVEAGWEASNAALYGGTFSYEEVTQRFAEFPNIKVIKGRVPEVLQGEPDGPIAFLHIDMNNPTAEIAALDLLFDRVSPGGVILFDDYAWMTARAQYDAERQWFADRSLRILPLPTGQGLFVKK